MLYSTVQLRSTQWQLIPEIIRGDTMFGTLKISVWPVFVETELGKSSELAQGDRQV